MYWIGSFALNEKFINKVKETWKWFLSTEFNGIYEDMENFSNRLIEAAKADYLRWENIAPPEGGIPVYDNTDITKKLYEVKLHMQSKVEWLKTQFGDFRDNYYPEPERDTTPYAELPDYITSSIKLDYEDNVSAKIEYFSIDGKKVNYPIKGQVYICIKDKSVNKIINK